MMTLTESRNEYKSLRAAAKGYTAQQFDTACSSIVHDIADGEERTPAMWLTAARIVSAGQENEYWG